MRIKFTISLQFEYNHLLEFAEDNLWILEGIINEID